VATYPLRWPAVPGALSYQLYASRFPGASYERLDQTLTPSYALTIDHPPEAIRFTSLISRQVTLEWDEPCMGMPWLFKAVGEDESVINPFSPDLLWVSGWTLPSDASWDEEPDFSTISRWGHGSFKLTCGSEPGFARFRGSSIVLTSGTVVLWVYTEKDDPVDSFWVSLYQDGWERRVYWGEDLCPYGPEGTPAKQYGGGLQPGVWAPLVFDLSEMDISAVTGMGFSAVTRQGTGILYVDSVVISSDYVFIAPPPYVQLSEHETYQLYRDSQRIGFADTPYFLDAGAADLRGFGAQGEPTYIFETIGEKIRVRWSVPNGAGTPITYAIRAQDEQGNWSGLTQAQITLADAYALTEVTVGVEPIPDGAPFSGSTSGDYYEHTALPGVTHYYRFVVKDSEGQILYTLRAQYTPELTNLLDDFVLDYSPLG
jgi:hypothetical protein